MAQDADDERRSFLNKVSSCIEHALETFFYKLGSVIGLHPVCTVVAVLLVAGSLMVGLLRFQQESRPEELWIPTNVDTVDQMNLVYYYFPVVSRDSYLIVTSTEKGNVLTPTAMRKLYELHESMVSIASVGSQFYQKYNISWDHLCIRRNPRHCWISSILSLWEFDKERIHRLTENDILSELNKKNLTDPWNGGMFMMNQQIGGIIYGRNHEIIGAKALQLVYRIYGNDTLDKTIGDWVDGRGNDFDSEVNKLRQKRHDGFHTSLSTIYGIIEESNKAAENDFSMLAGGFLLIVVYLCINLGRLTLVKHKLWLSIGGVISTGLGIAVSFGVCSAFGLFYGPVHTVLPFLLLGVGVDDMFVILSSWENLPEKIHKEKSISERIGLTLKEAGVSVAVTSLTDMVAFLVGASTVLPALKSFCIFAGVGVLFDLIFQITFFTALLAIDGMRVDARRDACLCCKLSDNYQETKCCWTWWPFQSGWLKRFIGDVYAPTLMKLPVKITVIVVAVVLFGISTYGVTLLERKFDFKWFLPSGSYILDYFENEDMYFPMVGSRVAVYTGYVDYEHQTDQLNELGLIIQSNEYIDSTSVDYWYFGYEKWRKENSVPKPSDPFSFSAVVGMYLNTSNGRRHQSDVKFNDEYGVVMATRLIANHRKLVDTDDKVNAMVSLRRAAASVELTPERAFVYADSYLDLEADLVIRNELLRNIGLAMVGVFFVTLLLIANIWSSLLVLVCVLLTLVNTAGMMHFWGLTIDVFTAVILTMSIGLAVDYSAHVAHGYLVPNESAKTSNERAIMVLRTIGTAVWNGGFSTFLAFVLLANSQSYMFSAFFKVFFLIVLFGLFHGLCFLPVVLSLIGSSPYSYSLLDTDNGQNVKPTTADGEDDAKVDPVHGHSDYKLEASYFATSV